MDNIENYESSVGKIDHAFHDLKKRSGSPAISSSDFEPVITQSENSTTVSAGSGYMPPVQGIGKDRTTIIEPKASSGSQMTELSAIEQKYLVCSLAVSLRFISIFLIRCQTKIAQKITSLKVFISKIQFVLKQAINVTCVKEMLEFLERN